MLPSKGTFFYGAQRLTPLKAIAICKGSLKGQLNSGTIDKINNSRGIVKSIIDDGKVVYGINTGFGSLCKTIISNEDTRKLQDNLLRSHSVGVGEPVPESITKLMMILKIHSLAYGYSGISLEVMQRLIWLLEKDFLPFVPTKGSLGASGDLAPLAHLFLPLIGLGKLFYKGDYVDTQEVYKKEKIRPLTLGPKEGLALINGTQFISAYSIAILDRMFVCLETADIIGAMSLEGILGSSKPFNEELHHLRPFAGCQHVAHRLRNLLIDSEMVASHAQCGRVQDPYSIRCMPQVHGASRNAWLHLKELVEIELNSVTDNPVIFSKGKTISGGNFHGQPLALPLDYCGIAASELGNISDRRTYLLLKGEVAGLPELLMTNTGINSGFMMPQYTSAALVSENKSLCYPASVDSIPTSLGQEDHVSMGSISARKTHQIIQNLEYILAVELLCAAQAFDYHKPLKSSKILEACHEMIRSNIDHAEEDRIFANDIKTAHDIITNKKLLELTYLIAEEEKINLKGPFYELFGIH
jgi:histidine ammonia-lyase